MLLTILRALTPSSAFGWCKLIAFGKVFAAVVLYGPAWLGIVG